VIDLVKSSVNADWIHLRPTKMNKNISAGGNSSGDKDAKLKTSGEKNAS